MPGIVTAGSVVSIVGGLLLIAVGTVVVTDLRGWGRRFVLATAPKDMTPERQAQVLRRYRWVYGAGAVLGVMLLASGLSGH